METIWVLLTLSAKNWWLVHHLDVKSAFLYGDLEEIYVTQSEGFNNSDQPKKVYKLYKAFYALRQEPRAWNSRLDKYLKGLCFKRCPQEYEVYTRNKNKKILIMGIYIDDLIIISSCKIEIKHFKEQMN